MKTWLQKMGGSEFKVMRLQDAPMLGDDMALDNPGNVSAWLRARLDGSLIYRPDVENFIVLCLTTRRRAIGFEVVSNGTLDTLLVHAREVFKPAIVMNAAAVVLVHNHPSGDASPSEADVKVTRDMVRAGQLLTIEVLDHVILGRRQTVGGKDYSSLRELGYFYV